MGNFRGRGAEYSFWRAEIPTQYSVGVSDIFYLCSGEGKGKSDALGRLGKRGNFGSSVLSSPNRPPRSIGVSHGPLHPFVFLSGVSAAVMCCRDLPQKTLCCVVLVSPFKKSALFGTCFVFFLFCVSSSSLISCRSLVSRSNQARFAQDTVGHVPLRGSLFFFFFRFLVAACLLIQIMRFASSAILSAHSA